jgi:hypothetical protein
VQFQDAVIGRLRLFRSRPGDADIRLADRDLVRTRPVAGANESRLGRRNIGAAHLEFGLERPAVDRHKQLAGVDVIAVAHEDFLDDACRGDAELHRGLRRCGAGRCLCEREGGQQSSRNRDAQHNELIYYVEHVENA